MKGLRAKDVANLLHKRFKAPEFAFLQEVRNETGLATVDRYADAIAMNLWPSRGMEVHGFEIKVSRADLLSELKNPSKSSPIQAFCDRWWLVLSDKSLIKPGELPPTWGLMVVRGTTQLRVEAEAVKLEPQPPSIGFVASLLRNFEKNYVPRKVHKELLKNFDKKVADAVEEETDQKTREQIERLTQQLESARREVKAVTDVQNEFQKRTGVYLAHWTLGDISEAVNLVKKGGLHNIRRRLEDLEQRAKEITVTAQQGLEMCDMHEKRAS